MGNIKLYLSIIFFGLFYSLCASLAVSNILSIVLRLALFFIGGLALITLTILIAKLYGERNTLSQTPRGRK